MELTPRLQQSLQQKLVMTPQMQQVIKLLQIPAMELGEEVRKELETNPTLEEADEEEPLPEIPDDEKSAAQGGESEDGIDLYLQKVAEEDGAPRESRDFEREERIEKLQSTRQVEAATLEDHLLEQVRLSRAPEGEIKLAEFVIGNLDDNGWLSTPVAEMAASRKVPPEKVEAALRLVQTLDPAGVGARDLRECLLLQLRNVEGDTSLARKLVKEYLGKLDHNRSALADELVKATGEGKEAVEAALRQVRRCDPKPGGRFTPPAQRIYPDARIEKEGKGYIVQLNDDGVPPLRLSRQYREMLAKRDTLGGEERKFLQEKFRSAQLLLRGIAQRRFTIQRVIEHLVKTQPEFLERGKAGLKPLTLRDVADKIGVHEATVSRVVANKYVETPRGVYALRDFFSTSLPAGEGTTVSGADVRERIRGMVEAENPAEPLSDEKLADLLKKQGIEVARRTVTKYRESLKIPGAWQRKGRSKEG